MIESYDGLCGIIPTFAHSGLQIRCTYELGHGGPCSFEKHRKHFYITAGSFSGDPNEVKDEDGLKHGFIKSVLYDTKFDHHVVVITSDNKVKARKNSFYV